MFNVRYILIFVLFTASIQVIHPLTLTFVGDIMCGSDYPNPKYLPSKPSQFFTNVFPYLSNADLCIGNLEGTIADRETKMRYKSKRSYNFRMPPYTAKMLRYGSFDILNLANNHSYDFGNKGLKQTIKYLREQQIGTTGIKGTVFKTNIGTTNIHVLGFSTYYYHDSLLDLKASKELITSNTNCDILIVSFHGGAEGEKHQLVPRTDEYYYREPRGNVYSFAHMAIDAGADLVIGHGPHVIRGMELYKGKLIAYSLGNFAGYKLFSTKGAKGISIVLTIKVDKQGTFLNGKAHSVDLKPYGRPIPDPLNQGFNKLSKLSKENFPESPLVFLESGFIDIQR